MFHSYKEVEAHILKNGICKRIALAGAHDEPALSAVIEAKRKGVVAAALIGDEPQIIEILKQYDEPARDYEIIHEPDEKLSAAMAVAMVKTGEADIPMKGLMQTSSFMRAILNKETGLLPPGQILNQCTVFTYPDQNRMMFAADCAVNIMPSVEDKAKILKNVIKLAGSFGIERPKVAVISALEKVNPKIPSTVEAAEIVAMPWEDCDIGGPYALDIAVDPVSAAHKSVADNVSGRADILLMPELCAGNIFHKTLHFFAHLETAGALCGTDMPVVMTSRTDSPATKYYSILTAIVQCC